MVQLLPLLEAVRDHPLPSTHASRRKAFHNEKFPESRARYAVPNSGVSYDFGFLLGATG